MRISNHKILSSLILAACCQCLAWQYAVAQTSTTTIHTPKGNAAVAYFFNELSSGEIQAANKDLQGRYPNAEFLSNSSNTYNCHGYAWHISEGGNNVVIIDPEPYLADEFYGIVIDGDGSYTSTSEPEQATKVAYYNLVHQEFIHSAVMTDQAGWVISKWGDGPLMRHHFEDSPYDVSLPRYFVKADPVWPFTGTYGEGGIDTAYDIQPTIDGRYLIAGSTTSFGASQTDAWILKADATRDVDYTTPYGTERSATLWQQRYGKALTDRLDALQTTHDRGAIAVGRTQGSGYDFWVLKVNQDGQLSGTKNWQKRYSTAAQDYATAVLETFHYEQVNIHGVTVDVTVDDGYLVAGIHQDATRNILLLKLDLEGVPLWTRQFDGPGHDEVVAIRQTTEGGYIVAASTTSFGNGSDVWVLKLDADGRIGPAYPGTWQRRYGGPDNEYAASLDLTSDGGYIVAGRTNTSGTAGGDDAWVLKLTASGTIAWQYAYGGPGSDSASHVIQTRDGGFLIAGSTTSFGANGEDAWVMKLTSDGLIGDAWPETWQKRYGGAGADRVYRARQLADGSYLAAGTTASVGAHSQDMLLLRLSATGTILPCCSLGIPTDAHLSATSLTGQETTVALNDSLSVSTYDITIPVAGTSATGQTSCCDGPALCNGDFEQGLSYWAAYQDSLDMVPGRSGQGLEIDGYLAYQSLPGLFEGGKTYEAAAWCAAAPGAVCQLGFGDMGAVSDPNNYENVARTPIAGNGTWQRIRLALTLSHDEYVQVSLENHAAGSAVAFDDVRVQETTACVSGVCNGDFEDGLDFWSAYQATIASVSGRSGQGLAVTGFLAYQDLPGVFLGGHTYQATVWCAAQPGEYCKIFFGDGGAVSDPANYEQTVTHYVEGTGSWQPLSATLSLTHDERLDIDVYAVTAGSTVSYDDMSVTEITSPMPVTPLSALDSFSTTVSTGAARGCTVLTAGTGTGRIIEYPATGHALMLKAIPGPNSKFVGWQVGERLVSGMIRADSDSTIVAIFERIPSSQ